MNTIWYSFVILFEGVKPLIHTFGFFIFANVVFHILKCCNKYLKRNIKERFYRKNNGTNERFKTMRECTDNYITYLEQEDNREKLSDFEKKLLEWYIQNFTAEKRKREIEKKDDEKPDGPPSLPVWIEDVIRFVNHPITVNISMFIVFFMAVMMISIVMSCNSQPISGLTTVESQQKNVFENYIATILTRDEIISSHIERNITHCKNITTLHNKYCYIDENDETIIADFTKRTASQLSNPKIAEWDPTHHQPTIITNLHSLYYLLHDGYNSSIMVNRVHLKNKLESIRRDEEKRGLGGSICICPSYLGIYGNITFIYNDKDLVWYIMYNPMIQRNNTLSTLVLSTIRYHFNSNFFVINQHIQQLYNLNDLEHYDSFVVQYDIDPIVHIHSDEGDIDSSDSGNTLDSATNPIEALSHMNNKVKKMENSPILLAKIKTFEKTAVHLSANNAICFTYCDALNRETMIK